MTNVFSFLDAALVQEVNFILDEDEEIFDALLLRGMSKQEAAAFLNTVAEPVTAAVLKEQSKNCTFLDMERLTSFVTDFIASYRPKAPISEWYTFRKGSGDTATREDFRELDKLMEAVRDFHDRECGGAADHLEVTRDHIPLVYEEFEEEGATSQVFIDALTWWPKLVVSAEVKKGRDGIVTGIGEYDNVDDLIDALRITHFDDWAEYGRDAISELAKD